MRPTPHGSEQCAQWRAGPKYSWPTHHPLLRERESGTRTLPVCSPTQRRFTPFPDACSSTSAPSCAPRFRPLAGAR
eukprot:576910-Prorocentrum_lima.AAC.1